MVRWLPSGGSTRRGNKLNKLNEPSAPDEEEDPEPEEDRDPEPEEHEDDEEDERDGRPRLRTRVRCLERD